MRKDLAELEREWVESTAAALWSEAPRRGDTRIVVAGLDYAVGPGEAGRAGAARASAGGGLHRGAAASGRK